MGVYLGQLPPAEIARFKAELAETIIANFSYPRFYDYRTNSLRMRPVDRAKRQEVWLFLSSVDFTTWSRIDLVSADFPRQIERLFIQFVQRNRSFFGEQGRKRMPDVRMLISSSAIAVAQGMRGHLSGQRQGTPFGSARPVVTWSAMSVSGKPEASWEQISNATFQLQQQMQEIRGEGKAAPAAPTTTNEGRTPLSPTRRTAMPRTQSEPDAKPPMPAPAMRPEQNGNRTSATPAPSQKSTPTATPLRPAASTVSTPPTPTTRRQDAPAASTTTTMPPPTTNDPIEQARSRSARPAGPQTSPVAPAQVSEQNGTTYPASARIVAEPAPNDASVMPPTPRPVEARVVSQPLAQSSQPTTGSLSNGVTTPRESGLRLGTDDLAIFEELQKQLIVWLRIELVRAGTDISGQTPPQLLELLRQQGLIDETRLQVISTLLNLADQVLKSGQVSILDYKQALLFHLMHTRHWK